MLFVAKGNIKLGLKGGENMSNAVLTPFPMLFGERANSETLEGEYSDKDQTFHGPVGMSNQPTATHRSTQTFQATQTGGHGDVDQDSDSDSESDND